MSATSRAGLELGHGYFTEMDGEAAGRTVFPLRRVFALCLGIVQDDALRASAWR